MHVQFNRLAAANKMVAKATAAGPPDALQERTPELYVAGIKAGVFLLLQLQAALIAADNKAPKEVVEVEFGLNESFDFNPALLAMSKALLPGILQTMTHEAPPFEEPETAEAGARAVYMALEEAIRTVFAHMKEGMDEMPPDGRKGFKYGIYTALGAVLMSVSTNEKVFRMALERFNFPPDAVEFLCD